MKQATQSDFRESYRTRIADLIPRHPPYGQHSLRDWLLSKRPENLSVLHTNIWREEVDKVCGGSQNYVKGLF